MSRRWPATGKTVGGLGIAAPRNRLDRLTAPRLYTHGCAWFSGEEQKKGTIETGELADLAVLSEDYLSVPEEHIDRITSVLRVVDGWAVHAADAFQELAPPPVPVIPSWSPSNGSESGYYRHAAPSADSL